MVRYCTMYFPSPLAWENTYTLVQYIAILTSHPVYVCSQLYRAVVVTHEETIIGGRYTRLSCKHFFAG